MTERFPFARVQGFLQQASKSLDLAAQAAEQLPPILMAVEDMGSKAKRIRLMLARIAQSGLLLPADRRFLQLVAGDCETYIAVTAHSEMSAEPFAETAISHFKDAKRVLEAVLPYGGRMLLSPTLAQLSDTHAKKATA